MIDEFENNFNRLFLPNAANDISTCPACQNAVPENAHICGNCSTVLCVKCRAEVSKTHIVPQRIAGGRNASVSSLLTGNLGDIHDWCHEGCDYYEKPRCIDCCCTIQKTSIVKGYASRTNLVGVFAPLRWLLDSLKGTMEAIVRYHYCPCCRGYLSRDYENVETTNLDIETRFFTNESTGSIEVQPNTHAPLSHTFIIDMADRA